MDETYEDLELHLFRAAQADLDRHAPIAPLDVTDLVDRVIRDGTTHRSGQVLPANHRTCHIPRQASAAAHRGTRVVSTMSVKW